MRGAQYEAEAARRRIARLSELSSPGIWDWEVSSGDFVVTPRLRNIFGFGPSEPLQFNDLIEATHPDDRDWPNTFLSNKSEVSLVRFRFIKRGGGDVHWAQSRIWRNAPQGDAAVGGYSGTVSDVSEEVATANALVESEERLRLAIEAGKMAVWDVDLQAGEMTQSPELNILCGYPTDKVIKLQDVRALYNPGEIERLAEEGNTVEAVSKRAIGGGFEPRKAGKKDSNGHRTQVQAEVAITTPSGLPKHLLLRAQYTVALTGRPKLTGLLIDVTDSKAAEEKLALVARELHHRVKNSLSVVQAIASQTFRHRQDVEIGLDHFLGRVSALATANDLILAHDQAGADLRELIQRITSPYRSGPVSPFVLEGPPVHIRPEHAASVGLVLHELCTNAVKYGALSVAGGEVAVIWVCSQDDTLLLSWTERNGPKVSAPTQRGFGSRLLERALSGSAGKVTMDFRPDGLHCHLELRISR